MHRAAVSRRTHHPAPNLRFPFVLEGPLLPVPPVDVPKGSGWSENAGPATQAVLVLPDADATAANVRLSDVCRGPGGRLRCQRGSA